MPNARLLALIVLSACAALWWGLQDPPDDALTPPAESNARSGPRTTNRENSDQVARERVTGSANGEPLPKTLRLAGELAPEPRVRSPIVLEADGSTIALAGYGPFEATLDSRRRSGTFVVRDADDRWYAEGSWDRSAIDRRGRIALGNVVLELRPQLLLRCTTDHFARSVAARTSDGRVTAEIELQAEGSTGPFGRTPTKQIAEFDPTSEATAVQRVRLPANAVGPQGQTRLRWRYARGRDDRSIIETVTLDALSGPLEETLALTRERTLTGRLQDGDNGVAGIGVRTLVRLPTTIQSGSTTTDPSGEFGLFVPAGSSGTIEPDLGSSGPTDWLAGIRVEIPFDRSKVLAFRVVDRDGAMLPTFEVGRSTRTGFVDGTHLVQPVNNEAFYLRSEEIPKNAALFVRTPNSAERLYIAPRTIQPGDDPLTIPIDETEQARGSLQWSMLDERALRPARSDPKNPLRRLRSTLFFTLEGTREIAGRKPFGYHFNTLQSQEQWSGLWPGEYAYEAWQDRQKLASGTVTIHAGEPTKLQLR